MSSESFSRMFNEVLRFTLPKFTGQQSASLLVIEGDSENAMIKDGLTDFVTINKIRQPRSYQMHITDGTVSIRNCLQTWLTLG